MMNAMNATIEKLRVRQILDMLPSLTTDSIDRIIAEAQVELWERQGADEELFNEAYDEMLARQHEADRCDDFLRRSFMLHGQTNALEGIK